jgi:hypothetical protein
VLGYEDGVTRIVEQRIQDSPERLAASEVAELDEKLHHVGEIGRYGRSDYQGGNHGGSLACRHFARMTFT